jgi:integrase
MAELLAPTLDVIWLKDLEQDLSFEMRPRSKNDRLLLTEELVEAGMTLMVAADSAANWNALKRARQYRNGLMVALLACCPIRLKNFAALELDRTFRKVGNAWWICLPASDTKECRPDERPVPDFLQTSIDRYVSEYRPTLGDVATNALWLSGNDGQPMSYSGVEKIVTQTTRTTLGVAVSPLLFRASAATTSATYASATPHLASALLHHSDSRTTEKHYNRATSLSAARSYAAVSQLYREQNRDTLV